MSNAESGDRCIYQSNLMQCLFANEDIAEALTLREFANKWATDDADRTVEKLMQCVPWL